MCVRLTVSCIHIKHFLDDRQLSLPGFLAPLQGWLTVDYWSIWNVLQAPSTVIPYPVYLGTFLQCCHRHRQFISEQIIIVFGGTEKSR